ncbi:hypothetical protein BC629DRAFT_1488958 [Irpex lacteus]|nr:hypothetical protein BC629DRAFT_1488958 [Irpex lacteus]
MSSADTNYPSLDHHEPHALSATQTRPSRGLSAGIQSRSSSASAEPLAQPPSMNVPISYYGPDQPGLSVDDNGEYQQWIQNYYANSQQQTQYAHPGDMTTADMSQMHYGVEPSSMAPQDHSQPMPNHYNFVPSPYQVTAHQSSNHDAYNQQYASTRTVSGPPRISQVPHSNNINRRGFRAQSGPVDPMAYQQPQVQVQPHYARGAPAAASESYFPPSGVTDRNQDFEFSFSSNVDGAASASGSNYTPHSDVNPLPGANTSPSSWTGTDEIPQYASHVPTTSAPVPNPSSSPNERREAPSRRKSNKRARPDPSVEPATASEDEDGPQSAVPPLRGPETNPQRL